MKAEPEALTGCNGITRVSPAGKVRPKPEVGSLAAARCNRSQTEQQGVTMKIADETKDYLFRKADIFMETVDRLSFWAAIISTVAALIFIILPALIKIFWR
jgi:hypothetical protein